MSLTPAISETLVALGAAERILATTDAPEEPATLKALPHVGSFGTVDIERLIALTPDLVLVGGNGYTLSQDITKLRSLGLPVVVVYAPTVAAVLADIRLVGAAIGASGAARTLADTIQARIDALTAAVAALPRPRVFYEVDATKEIYGPADRSFLAEMIERAGGQPITSGSELSFQIPLERLVAANPEVILLGDAAYGVSAAQVKARPGWATMAAARSGDIRAVNDLLITRPGPRIAEGLQELLLAIHPAARLP